MKFGMFFLTLFALLLMASSVMTAQSSIGDSTTLQGTLQRLSMDAAKSYVGPIVSGFGADLNGGWFHKAPRSTKLGFDLEIGVVAMGTFFKDENKGFSSTGSFQFDSAQAAYLARNVNPIFRNQVRDSIQSQTFTVGISGPTVVGSKNDSIRVAFSGSTINGQTVGSDTIVLPVTGLLENLSALPLAAPQLTIGTVFGTQVSFRYLPEIQLDSKIGSIKYFGFGIQHNPAVWFDQPLPVDLSVGYFTQTMSVGSLFSTSTTAFGVQASKQLGWSYLNLTPYLGYQFESSTMTFTYDYTVHTSVAGDQTQHVSFALDGQNKSRFTAGLAFRLLIFNLNADYNFGTYNSATAGLMISL